MPTIYSNTWKELAKGLTIVSLTVVIVIPFRLLRPPVVKEGLYQIQSTPIPEETDTFPNPDLVDNLSEAGRAAYDILPEDLKIRLQNGELAYSEDLNAFVDPNTGLHWRPGMVRGSSLNSEGGWVKQYFREIFDGGRIITLEASNDYFADRNMDSFSGFSDEFKESFPVWEDQFRPLTSETNVFRIQLIERFSPPGGQLYIQASVIAANNQISEALGISKFGNEAFIRIYVNHNMFDGDNHLESWYTSYSLVTGIMYFYLVESGNGPDSPAGIFQRTSLRERPAEIVSTPEDSNAPSDQFGTIFR